MTQPLPPIKDDPAIQAAFLAKQTFAAQAAAVRTKWESSDRYIATEVTRLWNETCTELARLRADFDNRRQARWDDLQAQIPTGPDIPADASPADRAVLQSLFRDAVERARAADAAALARMYTEARKFGDDITERAVFIAAASDGKHGPVIRSYKADHPELAAVMDELEELRLPAGRGFIKQALTVGPLGGFTEPAEIRAAARHDALDAAAGHSPVGVS